MTVSEFRELFPECSKNFYSYADKTDQLEFIQGQGFYASPDNVTLYKGTEPLLIAMDIHKEIKAALNIKVNMPSGGYLFIQQTEALTVIDVNSGKFVSSATQDEMILKTNLQGQA